MTATKEGLGTKERILQAASQLFAHKGYRDTTVQDICSMADANISSVNYHFGSKENLYDAAWQQAFAAMRAAYPEGFDTTRPDRPEETLRHYQRARLLCILSSDRLSIFPRIMVREMADPTPALERIFEQALRPQFQRMIEVVKRLLGPKATDFQLQFCLQAIHSHFVFLNMQHSTMSQSPRSLPEESELFAARYGTDEEREQVIESIYTFTMAGIRQIKEQL